MIFHDFPMAYPSFLHDFEVHPRPSQPSGHAHRLRPKVSTEIEELLAGQGLNEDDWYGTGSSS